jgi:hypothetical protein
MDVRNKYDGTPLGAAVYCAADFRNPDGDYASTIRCLIEAGAKIEGQSLQFAIEHELDDIAEVLKSYGATV